MIFFRTIKSFLADQEYRDLLYTTLFILLMGTCVYHFAEGWTWIDSAYFSVITLSTIGYGDFSPQTTFGKIFTIFYIIIGIGIILSFINSIYYHYANQKSVKKSKTQRS